RSFTWKSVGVEIHKGNSKFLTFTFRSTKQIIQLARSLQEYDELLKTDDEYLPSVDPETEGPIPELYVSASLKTEIETVMEKVKTLYATFPEHTIGIIANTNNRLEEYAAALDEIGIPWIMAKEDEADILSPGVKLVSFYSSKGLEFDHVIVSGLKEGILPRSQMEPGDDEEQFLATERRKLYVAMTRAKNTLTLSAVEPVSNFIEQLDPNLYRRCE
ncbi:MAG: 3'-5' exonuclease, partial [Tumebacillaceae bacterium]